MDEKNRWLVGFQKIELEEQNLHLMLCLEAKTEKIKTFAIGFQKIKIQNVIRNLENAIQKNEKSLILWVNKDSYWLSQTYQNFLKNWTSLVDSEKGSEQETTKMKALFQAFSKFLVDDKTLQKSLLKDERNDENMKSKLVSYFIEEWNKTKIDLIGPQNETNQKLLEQIAEMKPKYTEVLNICT